MKKSLFMRILIILTMVGVFLIGCTVTRPTSPVKTQNQPVQQISVTAIPVENSDEPPLPETSSSSVYFIALEDNGKSGPVVGCGDSLVAVNTQATDARTALQKLLENHNQWHGQSGLYNALYQSNLEIDSFETKNGITKVEMVGNLLLGGVCDSPRVEHQIKATIRQSSTNKSPVIIRINGTPLEELLSQK